MTDTIKSLESQRAKLEADMQKIREELFVMKAQIIKINKAIKVLQA